MSETRAKETSHHHDRPSGNEQAVASAQAAPTSVEPVAPQDSQAQGAASVEQRNLLQDNVSGSTKKGAAQKAQEHHESQPGGTAGVHSTGSHTGASDPGK